MIHAEGKLPFNVDEALAHGAAGFQFAIGVASGVRAFVVAVDHDLYQPQRAHAFTLRLIVTRHLAATLSFHPRHNSRHAMPRTSKPELIATILRTVLPQQVPDAEVLPQNDWAAYGLSPEGLDPLPDIVAYSIARDALFIIQVVHRTGAFSAALVGRVPGAVRVRVGQCLTHGVRSEHGGAACGYRDLVRG